MVTQSNWGIRAQVAKGVVKDVLHIPPLADPLPANVYNWHILLQKSQMARRQFSCCKKIRPTTADRCGLNHVTEVASEFIFRQ